MVDWTSTWSPAWQSKLLLQIYMFHIHELSLLVCVFVHGTKLQHRNIFIVRKSIFPQFGFLIMNDLLHYLMHQLL